MDGRNRRRQLGVPCHCLRPLIRIWGIATAIVVSGVGVDILVHGYNAGVYIIVASVVIFLLEIKWLFTLFIHLFCTSSNGGSIDGDYSSSSGCVKCWSICRFCGGWRLSFPYVALGIALIMWPHRLWLSHVAGGQLIGLAVLRLLTLCQFRQGGKDEQLLNQFDENVDKYDNLTDVLVDDSMPKPGQSLEDDDEDDGIEGHHDDDDDLHRLSIHEGKISTSNGTI
ncbi:uncharacterized protein LOC5563737 isoform X1 [Aedes aegypti]|uniref:Transmembrane protein n=1 Tax=Aedes aegypti TaxID=7159 RepID=A0A6I8TPQ8_AEDAE|nr:uncharacterized protein LOC5563737 isoform X1 [Aedes aegypti]XP_021697441.1 uncharacterized protein LOC5563737 isoform X1 [Aedes aegypti]XP_021697442.1 uncharacterized protein LOC5563737 isoform X1 [Aedes aegypti]XP_021697443.1 uncharacterized protein LOC5563737 isoform X1 [Aedes aegypti]XP_021697444.1 uncharacterized protein LOC5563737 isoform X1 [Aedes aegypti]